VTDPDHQDTRATVERQLFEAKKQTKVAKRKLQSKASLKGKEKEVVSSWVFHKTDTRQKRRVWEVMDDEDMKSLIPEEIAEVERMKECEDFDSGC